MAGFPLGTPVTNLVGSVFDPTASATGDNSVVSLVAGRQSELLASNLHGFYHTMAYRGRMFAARSAHAGVTIPIFSTTAQTYAILNPAGSGVNLELLKFDLIALTATQVVGAPVLSAVQNAPLSVILGGTVTPVAGGVQNLLLGQGASPKSSLNSAVTSVAQTDLHAIALGGFMATAVSPNIHYDIDGAIIAPPGTMLIVTSLIAAMPVAAVQFIYAEMPI